MALSIVAILRQHGAIDQDALAQSFAYCYNWRSRAVCSCSRRLTGASRTTAGTSAAGWSAVARCARSDAEHRATSAVWLEGVIAEPQLSRHIELPSVQLAGTILSVNGARPANFPGLASTVEERAEVNVAIPTAHAHAERLYRPGNIVRVAGQLDCRMEHQGGPSVAARLIELDAA
jgi:hypothetical protein